MAGADRDNHIHICEHSRLREINLKSEQIKLAKAFRLQLLNIGQI